jgi:hypothetical protein
MDNYGFPKWGSRLKQNIHTEILWRKALLWGSQKKAPLFLLILFIVLRPADECRVLGRPKI